MERAIEESRELRAAHRYLDAVSRLKHEIAVFSGDPLILADALGEIGELYHEIHQLESAIKYAKLQRDLLSSTKNLERIRVEVAKEDEMDSCLEKYAYVKSHEDSIKMERLAEAIERQVSKSQRISRFSKRISIVAIIAVVILSYWIARKALEEKNKM